MLEIWYKKKYLKNKNFYTFINIELLIDQTYLKINKKIMLKQYHIYNNLLHTQIK